MSSISTQHHDVPSDEELHARARKWMANDPDSKSRDELEEMLTSGTPELHKRFSGLIDFGTAGLRGFMMAGESGMNLATVILTTHALAQVLKIRVPEAATRGVVIGFDARWHSHSFAIAAARVLQSAGIAVHLFDQQAPTPLAAYALKRLHAAAAVVITASHNPKEYNGYKLYWAHGAQITPPIDGEIRTQMELAAQQGARLIYERCEAQTPPTVATAQLQESYLEALIHRHAQLVPAHSQALSVAYTPLHGVGGAALTALVNRLTAPKITLHSVSMQFTPDGNFPTVAFPNPEEAGALDMLLALAEKTHADLAIAHDPDADRLAVCIPESNGRFRMLTGNEVGAALGAYLLMNAQDCTSQLLLASVVSSRQLQALCGHFGAHYCDALTGFKWLMAKAREEIAKNSKLSLLFAYEEALGYCVGDGVSDKDGIGAALLVFQLAAHLKAKGQTFDEFLQHVAKLSGVYVSAQRTIATASHQAKEQVHKAFTGLAAAAPEQIGSFVLEEVKDYRAPNSGLPSSELIEWNLRQDETKARILLRPSGTEPKFKIYGELSAPLMAASASEKSAQSANLKGALGNLLDQIVKLFSISDSA